MPEYFSERVAGTLQPTIEALSPEIWRGLRSQIERRISDDSFGERFPQPCPDGQGICGCDVNAFWSVAKSENPGLSDVLEPPNWISRDEAPPAHLVMDLVEFSARHVAKPIQLGYHSYFRHHHFRFDRDAGLAEFVDDVRTIFRRNALAYQIDDDGRIARVGSAVLMQALNQPLFRTGDAQLDQLLESARRRFVSPDPNERQVSLEHLWDAFERVKTIEAGKDKRTQAEALLSRASLGHMHNLIDCEARELTSTGNQFRIKHSETNKILVDPGDQLDYLFHRMFA